MRFRVLLLAVIVACVAGGVFAGKADAIAFTDSGTCPVSPLNPTIFVCPTGETGKAYSLQVSARGGCDVYVWSNPGGGMPPGLSLGSSGLISGTPTTSGKFMFWLQIQDTPGNPVWCSDDHHAERQFEIDIQQGLQIVQRQSALTPAQVGQSYNQQFSAVGGSPTWSVSSGSLPAGLSLNASSGLLSGTATTAGDFSFKITATDGGRSDTQTYSMAVVTALKVSTLAAPEAEVGVPVKLTLAANGGKSGYTWSAANLPAGLTLDPAAGTITGTPTAPSTGDVKLTVADALGLKETVNYKLTVAPRVSIATRSLPVAHVGRTYRARFVANGGVLAYSWSVTRGLPRGVKLNATRTALTGTPTRAGTYRVTIVVKDKLAVTSVRTFVLRVVK